MKNYKMPQRIKPFANESEVIRIGDLDVENRLDRVSITGDLVMTHDKRGLALAKELQALVGCVVKALEAEKQLPDTVELKSIEIVKNPFA